MSAYARAYIDARPATPQNIDPSEGDDFAAFLLRATAATAARNHVVDELDIYL